MTITKNRGCRMAFSIYTLACIVAIAVCAICDFAISRQFTWTGIPALAVVFSWAVISPALMAGRRKGLAGLAGLSCTLFPFLFALGLMLPYRNWPIRLALPLCLLCLGALWLSYWLFQSRRVGGLYQIAINVALYGIAVNLGVGYIVARFTGDSFPSYSDQIVVLSAAAAAIFLLVMALGRTLAGRGRRA